MNFMSGPAVLSGFTRDSVAIRPEAVLPRRHRGGGNATFHMAEYEETSTSQHHAELFYLQKQIQSQTPMVIVMEDGETIEGCIEWYDRGALKVRGRTRMLIYKSAVKFMYKQGENGV
jgi:sRNA-binding regulator protein Hfq